MRDVLERDQTQTADTEDPSIGLAPAQASAERRPATFLAIFGLAFLAVLGLALLVNFLGNGSGMMPSPLAPSRLERAWKTRRIDALVQEGRMPQAIILGSSRVMQIRPDYVQAITGRRAFNYGVSMGCTVDFLTQLRYLLRVVQSPNC